jgi:hypothetical protein
MFNAKSDNTVHREQIKRLKSIIEEYELVKEKKHPKLKFTEDVFGKYKIKKQNFFKYYHRYQEENKDDSLLPRKRGIKYKTSKFSNELIEKIKELRTKGFNRYEIYEELLPYSPSTSTIYNIFVRYNMNRLRVKEKRSKKMIIKHYAGELGHIDCHHLPKGIVENTSSSNKNRRVYLIGCIDDCTRLAWVDVMEDITALTTMFTAMGILRLLQSRYDIRFNTIMTDNGSEFKSNNIMNYPFERLLHQLSIKHIYTKPYKPQANGKTEGLGVATPIATIGSFACNSN